MRLMKLDRLVATDVDCRPRKISANVNSRYRREYAGAADADPLQQIDGLVLWTIGQLRTLPIFLLGDWQCSDSVGILTGFLKPSMPRLKWLKLRIWTALSWIATATTSLGDGLADVSNFRLGCFQLTSPPSLLCFGVTGNYGSVIQPEKAFDGRGCYVGSGARYSGLRRQLLGLAWVDDEMRGGNIKWILG